MHWGGVQPGLDPRPALLPEVWQALVALKASVWRSDPGPLLMVCRERQAELLGANVEGSVWRVEGSEEDATPADAVAAVAFTEQFLIDVGGVTEQQRRALARVVGSRQLGTFLMGLYVSEYDLRQEMTVERLFPGAWGAGGTTAGAGDGRAPTLADGASLAVDEEADVGTQLNELLRRVALLDRLDPLTTELVRLRGARTHHCRICQSIRSVAALEAGGDEAVFDQVDHFEVGQLTDRQRAALRLTDCMITLPSSIDAEVVAELRRWFAPDEALEIVLDVVRNSAQKVAVALEADAPLVNEGVDYFVVDEVGDVQFGQPSPV